ncbi:uncharacterized protein LOC132549278, partial [Ylistrum balloti]|uniref:uncharacterized protein LOC132549278 n=1 Tax=Ylistrum balloti TaxID=509963 RepID=UPI002905DA22
RLQKVYKETSFNLLSNQSNVYNNGAHANTAPPGHLRYTRTAVAELPLAKNLNLMVDKALEKEHHSLTKSIGGFVALNCNTDVTKAIFKQYARASRQWVHNDNDLEIENDRMVYQLGILSIQALKTTDQGVYICRIEYEPKQFKSVVLFTLVVESNEPNTFVQETGVLVLQSNSAPIGYIFPTTTRTWWINDKMFRSNILASQQQDDRFEKADKSFEGVWTCIVSRQLNDGTKRPWKTARYVVKLTPPPSKSEQLLTYCSEHPVTIVVCGLVFSGFLLVIFIGCVYRADQDKALAQTEMDSMKERLISGKPSRQDNINPN